MTVATTTSRSSSAGISYDSTSPRTTFTADEHSNNNVDNMLGAGGESQTQTQTQTQDVETGTRMGHLQSDEDGVNSGIAVVEVSENGSNPDHGEDDDFLEDEESSPTAGNPPVQATQTRRTPPNEDAVNAAATRRLRCLFACITCPIIPLGLLLGGLLIYLVVAALFIDEDKPCDQPLKVYAVMSSCIASYMPFHKAMKRWLFGYSRERDGAARPLPVRMYDELFHACCLTWVWLGVAWISDCETCQETAPHLYGAARSFVIVLVICLMLLILPLVFLPCIYLWLVRTGTFSPSAMSQAAPPEVLENLARIEYDPTLFNDITNPRECCICMNEFGIDFNNATVDNEGQQRGDSIIVRTRCGHVFHKACLGGWLATSRYCPLCRENLVTPQANDAAPSPSVEEIRE
eukprot:CAMPEP_0116043342 /NCGR_PEP_ID=MMETSP0321-20121206/26299_1 /TAXON_ID=163516 /ORGANISM="Leptocylindrus danicus var. danicus, Strain B650" /LENGTH=404 /DNA_ID=CAMNT_0003524133 /DNA_START=230 /DNA_END=1444 /DNA_ORIENTATION=-